ncbi:cupredoxin domain-containing protein [Thiolinea disciformis]|uniref:cupredoxin domain-containing protein n=1 Tax=Thiolinea disciformis TaxID=125614 RepID=UPI00036DD66D|nr:plastocyanin/azurin family copper-binding protein [Thiolinea disciformis]
MQASASFQHKHLAMVFKYAGISFIAGSVSHGVFSGSRSLLTAGLGIIAFVIGTVLEYRYTPAEERSSLWSTLMVGALLSVGLGFFTGSLQHFPDSPARSLWAVPLGFALSLIAFALINRNHFPPNAKKYAAASLISVAALSFGAYSYFLNNPVTGGHDHGSHAHNDSMATNATPTVSDTAHDHAAHDHGTPTPAGDAKASAATASADSHADHSHSTHLSAIGKPANADQVQRVVEVRMDDNMRFTPDKLDVKPNEVVKIVVNNRGKIKHELTLGDAKALQEHAQAMLKHPNMEHNDPNMVALEPGQTGEIIWQFTQAGHVDFACLQPGHFEAGMKGVVNVGHVH